MVGPKLGSRQHSPLYEAKSEDEDDMEETENCDLRAVVQNNHM